MNGKRRTRRPSSHRQAGDARHVQAPISVPGAQESAAVRHVHRARDFGIGYGNSSGYGVDRHYVDGHADPMFRCV